MARIRWGYVRNTRGFPNDWAKLLASGIGGVMFNPGEQSEEDMLAAYNAARQAGLQVGIWDAPRNESAQQYARRMAGYSQRLNPALLSLDVEFPGKGYRGSAGWQYNEDLMDLYRRLAPNQETGVSMMPMQDDFNYGAYLRGGVKRFEPQAYGGGTSGVQNKFDPAAVVARLRANGVPEEYIAAVLTPGQSARGLRDASFYTIDDYLAGNRTFDLEGMLGADAVAGSPEVPGTPGAPDPSFPGDPVVLAERKSRADAYATHRLNQMVRAGVLSPEAVAALGDDPAAAWREASKGLAGAAQAAGATGNPGAWLRDAAIRQTLASGDTGESGIAPPSARVPLGSANPAVPEGGVLEPGRRPAGPRIDTRSTGMGDRGSSQARRPEIGVLEPGRRPAGPRIGTRSTGMGDRGSSRRPPVLRINPNATQRRIMDHIERGRPLPLTPRTPRVNWKEALRNARPLSKRRIGGK